MPAPNGSAHILQVWCIHNNVRLGAKSGVVWNSFRDTVESVVFQTVWNLKKSLIGNEVAQPWPKPLQIQSTQGRILSKNVPDEDRLTGLESDGYKTENNSSKIRNYM